jgi:hypothetical protein
VGSGLNLFGQPLQDDTFLMLFNPHHEPIQFYMPKPHGGTCWELCFDTRDLHQTVARNFSQGTLYKLMDRSFALFKETPCSGSGAAVPQADLASTPGDKAVTMKAVKGAQRIRRD